MLLLDERVKINKHMQVRSIQKQTGPHILTCLTQTPSVIWVGGELGRYRSPPAPPRGYTPPGPARPPRPIQGARPTPGLGSGYLRETGLWRPSVTTW